MKNQITESRLVNLGRTDHIDPLVPFIAEQVI
jgi:hypothetical protein